MNHQSYERRRHRRYSVRNVRGSLVLQMDVRVLDMSLTGLAVESWQPLGIGGCYDLKLHHGDEHLTVPAEVQWSRLVRIEPGGPGETRSVFRAGLDYRDALDDKAREILSFLEQNVVIDVERRVSGRFEMALDEPVGLVEQRDFLVREISLLGMSIETDLELQIGTAFNMELMLGERELEARGEVRNNRLLEIRGGEQIWEAGVAFQELSPESRRALRALVESSLE